jgi:CHAD domain-containing protein
MDPQTDLRRAIGEELLAAAEDARDAVIDVDEDAETAVHEFRKALRRARGVLSLVSRALPAGERRAARRGLRDARRALGKARDHSVAPRTLAALELDPEARLAANAVLEVTANSAPPHAVIKQTLADGAARAAAQLDIVVAALPDELEWSTLVDGASAIYRDARRARKAAKHSRAEFHRWRRRSKELTYQLSLLARFGGPFVGELHEAVQAATDAQSPAVDLIMVRDLARTYRDAADDAGGAALREAIETRLRDAMAEARLAGREVYRIKPRKFARSLNKASAAAFETAAPIS